MSERGRVVYSTGSGGSVRGGDAGPAEPAASLDPPLQSPRVRRDRSGRKGKTVTVAGPFVLVRDDAAALLGELKRRCGGGGTLKRTDGPPPAFELEIQGDHAERVVAELTARGYRAKRSGG